MDVILFVLFFRFLFVLLGPKGKAKAYHEIGRAIGTLMSDEVCLLGFCGLCVYMCLEIHHSRWDNIHHRLIMKIYMYLIRVSIYIRD